MTVTPTEGPAGSRAALSTDGSDTGARSLALLSRVCVRVCLCSIRGEWAVTPQGDFIAEGCVRQHPCNIRFLLKKDTKEKLSCPPPHVVFLFLVGSDWKVVDSVLLRGPLGGLPNTCF